jgi:hypothetical protein
VEPLASFGPVGRLLPTLLWSAALWFGATSNVLVLIGLLPVTPMVLRDIWKTVRIG